MDVTIAEIRARYLSYDGDLLDKQALDANLGANLIGVEGFQVTNIRFSLEMERAFEAVQAFNVAATAVSVAAADAGYRCCLALSQPNNVELLRQAEFLQYNNGAVMSALVQLTNQNAAALDSVNQLRNQTAALQAANNQLLADNGALQAEMDRDGSLGSQNF